jgi:hypothetical protein
VHSKTQVDELDEGLAQLAHLFADLGLVINSMHARIAAVDRLREPLKAELLDMQAAIDQVLPLL